MKIIIVALALFCATAYCSSSDRSRIPNGYNVPCPSGAAGCSGGLCPGFGHNGNTNLPECDGSPSNIRGPFGNDFYTVTPKVWNLAICQIDSDGDGKSNGDELGDPCCVWTSGTPRRTTTLSHPGAANSVTTQPSCKFTAPVAPAAPTFTSITPTSVTVNWVSPATSCVCSFRLFRDDGAGGAFTQVNAPTWSASTYTQTGLTPGTTYRYRMTSLNLNGESAQGTIASVTTTAANQPPAIPNPPTLSTATTTTLTVQWTAPNDNGSPITSYQLQRNGAQVYSGTTLSYTDTGLTAATAYNYQVQATNTNGGSGFSTTAALTTNSNTATPPGKPLVLTMTNATSTTIDLAWPIPASTGAPVTGYQVQMKSGTGTYSDVYTGANRYCTVSALTPGTVYTFHYRVQNSLGWGPYSDPSDLTPAGCLNSCSGHGTCAGSTCTCSSGWSGTDCSSSSMDPTIIPSDYEFAVTLKPDYDLYWNLIDSNTIEIALRAKTTGWVAIGFLDAGQSLPTADMVVGWVDDTNGVVMAYDYFNHDNSKVSLDDLDYGGTNDLLVFNGEQVDGYTSIKFQRRLDTGDQYDQALVEGTSNIMWAIADSDPSDAESVQSHASGSDARAFAQVDWFKGSVNNQSLIVGHGVVMTGANLFFCLAMLRKYVRKWMGKKATIFYYFAVAGGLTCLILGLFFGFWMGTGYKSIHAWLGFIVIFFAFSFPALGILVDKRNDELDMHGGPIFPHKIFRLFERFAIYGGIANGVYGIVLSTFNMVYLQAYVGIFLAIVVIHEIGVVCYAKQEKKSEKQKSDAAYSALKAKDLEMSTSEGYSNSPKSTPSNNSSNYNNYTGTTNSPRPPPARNDSYYNPQGTYKPPPPPKPYNNNHVTRPLPPPPPPKPAPRNGGY